MHISSLELKNFKRFTDLRIDLSQLDPPPKLVLLIGANGSGKSSVFDGFNILTSLVDPSRDPNPPRSSYYSKNNQDYTVKMRAKDDKEWVFEKGEGGIIHPPKDVPRDALYGRSSLRQVPRLSRNSLHTSESSDLARDRDRPAAYANRDERFENDLEEITRNILQEFYQSDRKRSEIIGTYIDPINRAFERIFGDDETTVLKLLHIIPPLDGKVADVRFKKGRTLSFITTS